MSAPFSDTFPRMEALQVQLPGQAFPACKVKILSQRDPSARLLTLHGSCSGYPPAGEAELRCRLAGFLLGEILARKLYGNSAMLSASISVKIFFRNPRRTYHPVSYQPRAFQQEYQQGEHRTGFRNRSRPACRIHPAFCNHPAKLVFMGKRASPSLSWR